MSPLVHSTSPEAEHLWRKIERAALSTARAQRAHLLKELVILLATYPGDCSVHTVQVALTFINELPAWVPDPELAIERDGYIEFGWYLPKGRALSLSVHQSQSTYATTNGETGRREYPLPWPELFSSLSRLIYQEAVRKDDLRNA